MKIPPEFTKTMTLQIVFGVSLLLCIVGCRQSHRISVTVETECDSILQSVELVFGPNSEYCGSIAKEGGYTVVGVEYPVITNEVMIHFVLEGKEVSLELPLKEIAPTDLKGHIEVRFTVICSVPPDVEISFWRFVKVDGKSTREKIS